MVVILYYCRSRTGSLCGVDIGSMRIYPIFLEATGYYDWLYGLQRLFRSRGETQVVVVVWV